MENFLLLKKEYLKKFGSDSLDRVILVDPLHPNLSDYLEASQILEKAIEEGVPLEQVPEKLWEIMKF